MKFHFQVLLVSFLIIGTFCITIDKASVKQDSTELMILRSEGIGNSFYNLKQLPQNFINKQNIFDSLHKLVENIYDFKKYEEDSFNGLKKMSESLISSTKQDFSDMRQHYEKSQQQLQSLQRSLDSMEEDYDKREAVLSQHSQELQKREAMGDRKNDDQVSQLENYNSLVSILSNIVQEISSDMPNKIKIDKYRSGFDKSIQDMSFPSKFNIQSKMQNLGSIQTNFNNNNSKETKEQLKQKYVEVLNNIKRERDSAQTLIQSNRKANQVEILDLEANINRMKNSLVSMEDDIQSLRSDIELVKEKMNIFRDELQVMDKSNEKEKAFFDVEKSTYKDKIGELEEQLQYMRQCNEYWQSSQINLGFEIDNGNSMNSKTKW